jgi:hypothetical protein
MLVVHDCKLQRVLGRLFEVVRLAALVPSDTRRFFNLTKQLDNCAFNGRWMGIRHVAWY